MEAWCEVVSKRKKGRKRIQESGDAKDEQHGEECLDEGVASEKSIDKIALSADETSSLAAAEVSKTSERWSEMVVNEEEEEEWVDVGARRKKNEVPNVKVGIGQKDNTSQLPWRQRQPSQCSPTAAKLGRDDCQNQFKVFRSDLVVPARDKCQDKPCASGIKTEKSDRFCMEERFKVLSEKSPKQHPGKGQGKQYSTMKANSDRFKTTRSEHSEKPTTPEATEKDDMKRKIRSEIFNEIDVCLERTCLKHSDFDMPCKQYLHAIHEKGGMPKVSEAIEVVRASALSKSRDTVRNWPGYVRTLLRNFFNDLRGSPGGATKEHAHGADNLRGAQSPELGPQSSKIDSPTFVAQLSGDCSPSLRPGGQCIIRENALVPCP
jgi:hypothetical protein